MIVLIGYPIGDIIADINNVKSTYAFIWQNFKLFGFVFFVDVVDIKLKEAVKLVGSICSEYFRNGCRIVIIIR